jgi:tetratricopeptide (TPR) repeat protein
MKYTLVTAAALCLGLLCGAVPARAADTIYLKGTKKTISGTIAAESARGVEVRGLKEVVPAEAISSIDYQWLDARGRVDADARLKIYLKAVEVENKALAAPTAAKRVAGLTDAIARFEAGLARASPKQPFLRRYLAYKAAALTAKRAELSGREQDQVLAAARLKDFWKKNPDSWEVGRVLTELARIQVGRKAYGDAEETFQALAKLPVSEAVRQEAELKAAGLSMKAGNYEAARQKLAALAQKLPADSPAGQRAQVSQAECLAELKKLPEALALLGQVLARARDGGVKAAAYNALGACQLQGSEVKEALWSFLWVDLVYNRDPAEHARALYYLHRVFGRLNESDRARECLQTLLTGRQFAGLEYRVRAEAEQKRPAEVPGEGGG